MTRSNHPTAPIPTREKLDEMHALIEKMEIAFLTTRRPDGMLVTRPMATQKQGPGGMLWFVTDIETHKVDELAADPHVCLGYYDSSSREWVSVSGRARLNQDRAMIRDLWAPDWKMWFGDEGGARDGGPEDPRLALIEVHPESVVYMKAKYSKPRVLFELARGMITGTEPDVAREERISSQELRGP